MFRVDPGPCLVCGAAHSACRGDTGPITQQILPATAAAAGDDPLVAVTVQATLPSGQFTSGTYRGKKKPLAPNTVVTKP